MKVPKAKKLPSGMWRVQVMMDGERVSITDTNPNIAEAEAAALKAGVKQHKAERKDNITLADAMESYITARGNVLSPSTVNGYNEIKRNRFLPLQKKKIYNIDEEVLQAAVNAEAKGLSNKTIKNALGFVVSVISQYKQINIKRIRLPQKALKEHSYLDETGIMDLMEAIVGNPVEIPILLAVWLGMRRSEIMGLCWDNVDIENRKIRIQRTYVKNKEKGYVLRDELKTAASRRVIDCPGYIMGKLEEYASEEKRDGRIFKMHPNTIYATMKKVCEKRGIDFVGVHGLRHTNATVMLSLGVIDKVAMARGGWSTDITMKQIYQHLFESDKHAAGERIDAFFDGLANNLHTKLHT